MMVTVSKFFSLEYHSPYKSENDYVFEKIKLKNLVELIQVPE